MVRSFCGPVIAVASVSVAGWMSIVIGHGVRLAVQNFSQIFSTGFCLGGKNEWNQNVPNKCY